MITEILLVINVIRNPISVTRAILDLLSTMTRLYQSAPFALFCVLTLATSWQFELISFRLEKLITISPNSSHNKIIRELKLLIQQHVRVCQSVKMINDVFGCILFVEVTFIFVGVINLFMFVLVSSLIGETENMLFNGAIALDFCVRLFVLSYVSESLGKKVKFSSVLFF